MRDQRNFERYGNGFRPEEDKILKTAFSVQHEKKKIPREITRWKQCKENA